MPATMRLVVARANLSGVGRAAARVRMERGSWFGALPGELRGDIDLVVSNPPYVAEALELPADVADVGARRCAAGRSRRHPRPAPHHRHRTRVADAARVARVRAVARAGRGDGRRGDRALRRRRAGARPHRPDPHAGRSRSAHLTTAPLVACRQDRRISTGPGSPPDRRCRWSCGRCRRPAGPGAGRGGSVNHSRSPRRTGCCSCSSS